jgi:PIN domain nuclease of toxin-antitoxin system
VRLLLDTHILIWAVIDPDRLSPELRDLLVDPAQEVLFSAASIWEIAIKAALKRADFGVPPEAVLEGARASGFVELQVTSDVALTVARLPLHHRDPFDRLLVAQAMREPAVLYTADSLLAAYSRDLVVVV